MEAPLGDKLSRLEEMSNKLNKNKNTRKNDENNY
jgi:hypothetical protein